MKNKESITNRAAMKRYIINRYNSERSGHQIERVSAETLDKYEAQFRNIILRDIKTHPTVGVTFKI